jgi:hypothetical protein
MAVAFGVGAACLQVGRVLLWGYWPPLRQIPVDVDGYLACGMLLFSAFLVGRGRATGPALLAASWGVSCGLLYRSFTEQLADPTRHAGHEVLVMAVKAALLAFAIVGLVGAVRAPTGVPSPKESR